MEFDQFLEKDMLSFLDGKIERKHKGAVDREEEYGLYLTKDYIKELTAALDNDELTKAKKLFDELKQAYNALPKSSLEKKKIYGLLEQMYAKIEAYVRMRTHGASANIPLVISEAVEKDKNYMDNLDMQSSILDKHLEGLDKKSVLEKKMPEISDEIKVNATEKDSFGNTFGNNESISEDVVQKPKTLDGKTSVLDKLDTMSLEKPLNKNKDAHKDISHASSKDKSVEIFKIPKNIEKHIPDKKSSDKTKKDFTSDVTRETLHTDKSPKLLEKSPLPATHELYDNQSVHMYKIPHPVNEKKTIKKPSIKEQTTDIVSDKKIESYKIVKAQEKENADDVMILEADKVKYLERIEHVEKMYFEGIYLFYNHKYQEAYALFEKVLSVRPRSKAAKIRIKECMEAIESG